MTPNGRKLEAEALRAQAKRLLEQAEQLEADRVSVVYLNDEDIVDIDQLCGAPRYDYIDGTDDGLRVGDYVYAPVEGRYFDDERGAIVVALGGAIGITAARYDGPIRTIIERVRR